MVERILLESGTNEMELLVFRLRDTLFGINVAKVREIINSPKTIPIPRAPDAVEGSFQLREEVLTLVNIGRYMGMEGEPGEDERPLAIVVEFNKTRCGVMVDAVEIIHRIRWDEIEPPPPYLLKQRAPLTGVAHVDNRIVQIADFESIVGDILGIPNASEPDEGGQAESDLRGARLIIADDSGMIRRKVEQMLRAAGFEHLTVCRDGLEAWECIEAARGAEEDGLPFDVVLTDIEMPRMDGLNLTRRIKEDPGLKNLPVVIFSSLVSEDNLKKGDSVGADAQVTKLEGDTLVRAIRQCLNTQADSD